MNLKPKTLIFYWLHLALIPIAIAQEQSESDQSLEDMSEMMELMEILEEETSIATKSKVNSDYVPGMVTVLNGEDMQALGKLTVWDALSQVPGIKTLKNNNGSPLIVVRGMPFPFNTGNVKIMVNSITMSSETSGLNNSILLMPIEQVERIEFIRGPSSSIYGNSAYMGLINIITYKENKGLYLNHWDGHLSSGTGQYYWQDDEQDLTVHANVHIQRDSDAITPENTHADEEKNSIIWGLEYKNTQISAQWFERKFAQYDFTPRVAKRKEQIGSISLNHKMPLNDELDSGLRVSYRKDDYDENKIYKGSEFSAQLDFNWRVADNHQLLMGFAFEHYEIDEATLCINSNHPLPGEPAFIPGQTPEPNMNTCPRTVLNPPPPNAPFGPPPNGGVNGGFNPPPLPNMSAQHRLLEDESWHTYGVTIQDQYAFSPDLTLTTGVSINRNANIDETNISPRLALVWQMAERHLLKGQYTKGFRSPTYFELYDLESNQQDLDSEQVDSYELGYIYKHNDILGRITLFHSKLKKLIHPRQESVNSDGTSNKIYQSSLTGKTSGVELEWEQKINHFLKWSFNISYADSTHDRNGSEIDGIPPGMSRWLGNVNVYIQPQENLLFTANYYQISEQYGPDIGNQLVDGYKILDVTMNLSQFIHKRMNLRLGIKNLFNDEINYFDTQPSTTDAVTYPGRTWWAQLSYRF